MAILETIAFVLHALIEAGGAYGFIAVPAQAWPMGHGSAEVTQVLRWFAFALVSHVGVALFGAFAHLSSGQRKALLASLGLYHVLIVADIVRRFLEVSYVWQEALIAHGVLAFLFLLALAVPSANATPNKSNSAKSK